jgi:hypothetical protein
MPVLLVTFTIYFIYTAALLPLAFVKVFFHKMVMVFMYSKSYRVHKSDKFMQWVLFAVIGGPRMIANFFVDLVSFLQHCLKQDIKKTKASLHQRPLSKQTLQLAHTYLVERQERMIPLRSLASELRNQMGIFDRISLLLKPQSTRPNLQQTQLPQKSTLNLKPFHDSVKQYCTLKQILVQNSETITLHNRRVKAVDCKVLAQLFEDALRQKSTLKIRDDNYIFIRRAVDIKTEQELEQQESQRLQQQAQMDSKTSYDFEQKLRGEKLLRNVVSKLIHAQSARVLKVVGTMPSDSDRKRLEFAIDQFGYLPRERPSGELQGGVRRGQAQELGFVAPALHR